jgi:hypothetical protein
MAVRIRSSIFASIVWLLFSQPAFAWSDFGHMAVAWVCYQHLTPQVKQRANDLLKLNPLYAEWSQQASPDDKDEQIFLLAATWPDIIKLRPEYFNDAVGSPTSRDNIGYADKNMHKYWHFADYPYSQDHTPLPPLPVLNAETQIAKFQQVLASGASDELKSYDLCWIMHIVGDVHEPLHCINRSSKDSPFGDNGANEVKLTNTEPPVLHKFWDNGLGPDGSPPSAVLPIAKTLTPANKRLAAETDSSKWIKESHQIAIDKIYKKPIGKGDGPYTLTGEYKRMAAKLVRERVELAGERLANLLNQSLK